MKRIVQSFCVALLAAAAMPVQAQGGDPAAASLQNFYDVLTASMKAGGTAKSRYDRLKPAVDQDFDLPGMTALSVGPTWASISPADQKALTDAFERMTIANYARNFDSYSGEKFTVDPAVVVRGSDKLVKSSLKPGSGDAIAGWALLHESDLDEVGPADEQCRGVLPHQVARRRLRARTTLWPVDVGDALARGIIVHLDSCVIAPRQEGVGPGDGVNRALPRVQHLVLRAEPSLLVEQELACQPAAGKLPPALAAPSGAKPAVQRHGLDRPLVREALALGGEEAVDDHGPVVATAGYDFASLQKNAKVSQHSESLLPSRPILPLTLSTLKQLTTAVCAPNRLISFPLKSNM